MADKHKTTPNRVTLSISLSKDDLALLKRGAELDGRNLSAFVTTAAVQSAEMLDKLDQAKSAFADGHVEHLITAFSEMQKSMLFMKFHLKAIHSMLDPLKTILTKKNVH
ncbi:MAG: DUF1778 domain-containing protein [Bdellovibrionia bacterium]